MTINIEQIFQYQYSCVCIYVCSCVRKSISVNRNIGKISYDIGASLIATRMTCTYVYTANTHNVNIKLTDGIDCAYLGERSKPHRIESTVKSVFLLHSLLPCLFDTVHHSLYG